MRLNAAIQRAVSQFSLSGSLGFVNSPAGTNGKLDTAAWMNFPAEKKILNFLLEISYSFLEEADSLLNKIDDSVIFLFGIKVNLVSKCQHDQSVTPQTRSKRFCEFSNGPGVVVTESPRGHICAEQEKINGFYFF